MRLMTNMGDIKMQWKERVLRVIVDKTKGMQLLFGKKSSVWKADPGVVCGELVGCNSIQYEMSEVGSSLLF